MRLPRLRIKPLLPRSLLIVTLALRPQPSWLLPQNNMSEAEWKTRKERIDKRLRFFMFPSILSTLFAGSVPTDTRGESNVS